MNQERKRLYGVMFNALGIAETYHEPTAEKVAGM
jgi:hypothetical protein